MKISKHDLSRKIDQVLGIAPEMRSGLDEFGKSNPQTEICHGGTGFDAFLWGRVQSEPQGRKHGQVVKQSEVKERSEIYGVNAPRLVAPYRTFNEKTGEVTSPGGTDPTKALGEKLGIFPQCGFHASTWGMLKYGLPAMVDHPAGNEIIIVGMKWSDEAEKAVFMKVFMHEVRCC